MTREKKEAGNKKSSINHKRKETLQKVIHMASRKRDVDGWSVKGGKMFQPSGSTKRNVKKKMRNDEEEEN